MQKIIKKMKYFNENIIVEIYNREIKQKCAQDGEKIEIKHQEVSMSILFLKNVRKARKIIYSILYY